MSSAPSKTGCFDSFTTKPHGKTEPATSMPPAPSRAAELPLHSADETRPAGREASTADTHYHRPTNLPLGVSDLTLRYKGGPPITGNRLPYYDEQPLLFTVRFANKPVGADKVVMNVILSQLDKGGKRRGESGWFSKYDSSTTYTETVPIETDAAGHSITIEIGHASAPSGGFHGGDGPYDVYMSCTPVVSDDHHGEADERSAHEHDEADDEHDSSQTVETLRYTLYGSQTRGLTYCLNRFFMWLSRVWDGV